MNNEQNFERNKNIKATSYTILVCILLLLAFTLNSFSLPKIEKPIAEEGIEVNLGDADNGLGNVQPETVGEPSNATNNESQATTSSQESIDENGDEPINTPTKVEPAKVEPKPTPITPKPEVKVPKVETPKATFPGAKPNGGNNGTKNNNSKSQGDDFGNGDKGKPNGNPNSNSYKGTSYSGNNGLSIKSGLNGRSIKVKPNFTDDFTENAKVLVDVTVDDNGNVTNATINPRGTTTTNSSIREIAKRKAREIKFNAGKDEDFGTLLFDFKVNAN